MNSKQRKRIQYLKDKGWLDAPALDYSTTENGITYEYPSKVKAGFENWSRHKLSKGAIPTFTEFYNLSYGEYKKRIKTTINEKA